MQRTDRPVDGPAEQQQPGQQRHVRDQPEQDQHPHRHKEQRRGEPCRAHMVTEQTTEHRADQQSSAIGRQQPANGFNSQPQFLTQVQRHEQLDHAAQSIDEQQRREHPGHHAEIAVQPQ
ncbi:hypothetical protein D3C87_1391920 [compost metagenome]